MCGSPGEQLHTGGGSGFKQNKVLWKPFMYLSCLCQFEGSRLPPKVLGLGLTGVGSAGAVCTKQFGQDWGLAPATGALDPPLWSNPCACVFS